MSKENYNTPYWDAYMMSLATSRRKAKAKHKNPFITFIKANWDNISTWILTLSQIGMMVTFFIYLIK